VRIDGGLSRKCRWLGHGFLPLTHPAQPAQLRLSPHGRSDGPPFSSPWQGRHRPAPERLQVAANAASIDRQDGPMTAKFGQMVEICGMIAPDARSG
jgi:hypothetical protein